MLYLVLISFFLAIFNALNILSGAMALRRQDRNVVIPDMGLARNVIQRGLALIRRVRTNSSLRGGKLQQSEHLLEKLTSATIGHGQEKVRIHIIGVTVSVGGSLCAKIQVSQTQNNKNTPSTSSDRPRSFLTLREVQSSTSEQALISSDANINPYTEAPSLMFSPPPPRSHGSITNINEQYSGNLQYNQSKSQGPAQKQGSVFTPHSSGGNGIDNVPSTGLHDWITPPYNGGETSGIATADNISSEIPPGNTFIPYENEDKIQTLFYNSFDIWSSLDNTDTQIFG